MDDVREVLERLIAFDTTSRGSNLDLIAYVEGRLADHDVPSRRIPNSDGTKANLLARIGPRAPGGVVLCGHTDCVPVDGQRWSTDPFALREESGRLYGRGTADMKGFLAVVLAELHTLVDAGLTRPVLLALTYDEELGALGAPDLVRTMLVEEPRPAAVIVGEPTSLGLVDAHKGVRAFTVTVEGLDAHSSQPQRGANAVAAVARIAAFVDDLADAHRDAASDPRFDPPYTTFNLATVAGGQAINIIPRHAELTWEYRPVPADDTSAIADEVRAYARTEVLPRLRRTHPAASIDIVTDAVVPSLGPEDDPVAERLVRALTGNHDPTGTVAFGTDGGHFQAEGISTIVHGPGSIDEAHQPDEFVEVEQLERFRPLIGALAERLSRATDAGG